MLGILELSTEVTFWALTFLTFVATLWFWQQLAKRSLLRLLSRIGLLLLIQVLALTSIGLTINRSNDFFASWGDLVGAKNALSKVAINPESLSTITSNDLKEAKVTKGGSLIFKKIITGAKSKVSDYVYLVTSPALSKQLESAPSPSLGNNYQVIEFLPGFPGVPQTWIGAMDGIGEIERGEKAGKIRPTLSVIPSINVVRGTDTECLDIPGLAYVETWLTVDMKTFVRTFMGIDDRRWSTFGYSTGGWCAAMLGIRHQDQYKSAVSIAGYFEPSFSSGIITPERKILRDKYDLAKITASQTNDFKLMAIYSRRDEYSYISINKYLSKINGALNVKLVVMPNAGHNTKSWKPFVSTGLDWLASSEVDKTAAAKK